RRALFPTRRVRSGRTLPVSQRAAGTFLPPAAQHRADSAFRAVAYVLQNALLMQGSRTPDTLAMRAAPQRHTVSWARAAVGILTLALAALTHTARADTAEWQSPESVRAAARDFVVRTAGPGVRVEIVAVDERLKLPACSEPLVAGAQNALRMGQGTVAV